MNITAIQNNNFKYRSFFGANNAVLYDCNIAQSDNLPKNQVLLERGQIKDGKGELFNRHVTEYCRTDMNWIKLERVLRKKFPNPNDVNFVIYAASTGEEPYTVAMLLNKIYGKPVPIQAFDISQGVIDEDIKHQKEGVVIDLSDTRKIYETLRLNSFNGYFKTDRLNGSIKIDKRITDCVEFKRSNILDDIDKIDSSKPAVLMARNMWPYVKSSEYKGFCEKLRETLSSGSLFIIGTYDYNGENYLLNSDSFPRILSKHGFKPVSRSPLESFRSFNLIFEKK